VMGGGVRWMRSYSRWRDWGAAAGAEPTLGMPRFVLGSSGGTILSVIFAIVALSRQIDRRQRGRGLAIAAMVSRPRGSRSSLAHRLRALARQDGARN